MIALRRYRPEDVDHFVGLFGDGDVSGFVGGPRTEADSRELFDSLLVGTHERAACAFAVLEDDAMVGHAVLFRTSSPETLELGYMIEKSAWGRGVGTATARALLDAAIDRGAQVAIGTVDQDNHASRRILEKLGGCPSIESDEDGTFVCYRFELD